MLIVSHLPDSETGLTYKSTKWRNALCHKWVLHKQSYSKRSCRRESQTYYDKKLRQDKKDIDKETKAGYDGKEVDKKAKER